MTVVSKIAIGADHGGFNLKTVLVSYLRKTGYHVEDVGTSSREAVDYPVYARAVAEAVSQGRADAGIVIDGAGIGTMGRNIENVKEVGRPRSTTARLNPTVGSRCPFTS